MSVLLLVGCGAPQEKEDAQSKQEEQVVNASDENMVVFPEGAMSIGEGKVKVITPDGTSENGNIPTVFIKKDTLIQQVELELSNFQSDKETFVFVDQMYTDKHQVTSTTQTTVQLKEKRWKQVVIQLLQFSMKTMTRKERLLVLIKQHLRQNLRLNKNKKYITQKVVCFLFGLECARVNNLFHFLIRLNRK